MQWIQPKFTNKAVSRAGDILLNYSPSTEEYKRALMVVNNWRSSQAFPLTTSQTFLRAKAIGIDKNSLIAQRLKRIPSILDKLSRFPGMRLHRMQDIGGCRAVVSDIKKVRRLSDGIVNSRTRNQLVKKDDYISLPKPSGYRGIHLVYKYQGTKADIFTNHLVEMQIRTRVQHAWATAVEIMGTFLHQSLKSSQGPEEWLDFLKLVAILFSDFENCLPEENEGFDLESIKQQVKYISSRLGVFEKLQAFSVSTKHIGSHDKDSGYFLLQLSTDIRRIRVNHFSKKRLSEATDMYLQLEREHENAAEFDVVLVAAKSVRSLRVAYPNYFADSRTFLRILSEVAG